MPAASLVATLVAAVSLVACGGGGDGDDAGDPGAGAAGAAADVLSSPAAPGGAGGAPTAQPDGPGAGRAVVTIGDETFEFEIGYCTAMGGVIHGSDFTDDGLVRLDLRIPTVEPDEGMWEYRAPEILIGDDRVEGEVNEYGAGDEVSEDSAMDFTVEGARAHGTVTFVDLNPYGGVVEDLTTTPGTFDIDCGT